MKNETKVGLFVILALAVVGYMTLKVGGGASFTDNANTYFVTTDSALGINDKTPVLIAGYQAGVVDKIALEESRRARLRLAIDKNVALPEGTVASVKAKGFLGETYIEVVPGPPGNPLLADGAVIPYTGIGGDVNQFISRLNDMTGPASNAVNNLDKFAEIMKDIMVRNEQNVNRILENFAALSSDLRQASPGVNESVERIASITRKVDEGKGTLGKLVNDDRTITKINQAADNFNSLTGSVQRMQTEIGYHTEFLGASKDFKNYAHLALKPRPDQAFLIDFVSNPSPPPDVITNNSTITVGGTTTTVATSSQVANRNRFRVSAQIAKKFYDWRLRGGIIESRGGVGMDYIPGPFSASVDAWDFGSNDGRKPEIKVYGNVNMTKSIYLMGGGNDLANKGDRNWFVGAGVRVLDDDVKSLFGLGGLVKR